jgi:hypothetical protein
MEISPASSFLPFLACGEAEGAGGVAGGAGVLTRGAAGATADATGFAGASGLGEGGGGGIGLAAAGRGGRGGSFLAGEADALGAESMIVRQRLQWNLTPARSSGRVYRA